MTKEELIELRKQDRNIQQFYELKYKTWKALVEADSMPNPITDWWVGMVRTKRLLVMKDKLEVGEIYYGSCRNARYAMWNGERFTHVRSKWGSEFLEDINHFEDCDGYDVFQPYFKIEDKYIECIPLLKYEVELLKGFINDKEKRSVPESTTVGEGQ